MRVPCVYIMASGRRGTIYVGVTSNLQKRVAEHKLGHFEGFTHRYSVGALVWFERHDSMPSAFAREDQLKNLRRLEKVRLIEDMNPEWLDLYEGLF